MDEAMTFTTDEPAEIIYVDERIPNDRCFRFTPGYGAYTVGREVVDAILGSSPIGWTGDGTEEDSRVKTIKPLIFECRRQAEILNRKVYRRHQTRAKGGPSN